MLIVRHRTAMLLALVALAVASNILFFWWRMLSEQPIIFVDIATNSERAGISTKNSEKWPVLNQEGDWIISGRILSEFREYIKTNPDFFTEDPVHGSFFFAGISLGQDKTYGQFLRSIIDLKHRHICSYALLDDGFEGIVAPYSRTRDGRWSMESPYKGRMTISYRIVPSNAAEHGGC